MRFTSFSMNDEGIREVASKGSVGQAKAENPIAEVDEGKLAETLEEQMKELVALKKYRRESAVVDWYPRDLENVYLAARSSSSLTEAREKIRKIRLRKELEAVLDWESDGGMIRALGQYDPSRIPPHPELPFFRSLQWIADRRTYFRAAGFFIGVSLCVFGYVAVTSPVARKASQPRLTVCPPSGCSSLFSFREVSRSRQARDKCSREVTILEEETKELNEKLQRANDRLVHGIPALLADLKEGVMRRV
uniref:Transmembrane protein n=1 Tax=Rhodosorus marinus TaxID=101924 RepID=A0A7S2ZLE1_9RHOD|mmetsp:Transcript_23937/g.94183  ORF Transcript_23937/g.94183 Transcript_23937/m.94183 type:complete len:249 (+) Transcript_23937:2508-3254(+)